MLLNVMKPNIKIAGAFTHYDKILPVIIKHRSSVDFVVYDGINECRWNGGRINRPVFDSDVQKKAYETLGVGIALVFSNNVIDLNDAQGNELLEKYHRDGNAIILQDIGLLEHIRNKFPKYECIFSITGHPGGVLTDPLNYYQHLESLYDVIVPKLEHNMLIEQYAKDVSKYELLINDDCLYNCPLWKKHFDKIAEQNTQGIKYYDPQHYEENYKIEECWLPKFDPDLGDQMAKHRLGFKFGMSLSPEQIKDRFRVGIHRLKISGREMNTEDFNQNFNYLVKTIAGVSHE